MQYQDEIQKILERGNIPQHVAIIMDGNGRWAKAKKQNRVFGHREGIESVRAVVEAACELGIKVLTLYAFSDENWGRPKLEVAAIMTLLDTFIVKERNSLHEKNIRFQTIGDIARLPQRSQKLIAETSAMLSENSGLILNIALSYGSTAEITQACKKIATLVQQGQLSPDDISPQTIKEHLFTSNLPDPDLIIRTSGELRLSNFLLWQAAYSELYFTRLYWPDFRKLDFANAITSYQMRSRRFGLLEANDMTDEVNFDKAGEVIC